MSNQQYFAGAIWTNHAIERLDQRGLSQDIAGQTFKNPDKTVPGKVPETFEYTKRFGPSIVTLIVKQNEKQEWLVLSNWIDPPLAGTEDYKKREEWKKYKNAGFWGKFLITLRRQLGF